MKLITKPILERLPQIGDTTSDDNPMVWVKLFDAWSQWTWYLIEFDGDDECFSYVKGLESELGDFRLSEIQSLCRPHQVERDRYFKPCRLSVLIGK